MAVSTESRGSVPREHVVQFYGSDHELTEKVGDYLVEALRNDEAVVIVSTPPHRAALEGRIAQAGIDLARARSAGTLVARDADATLQSLLVDGLPDPGRFEAVVGDLIRRDECQWPACSRLRRDGRDSLGGRAGRRGDRAREALERAGSGTGRSRSFAAIAENQLQARARPTRFARSVGSTPPSSASRLRLRPAGPAVALSWRSAASDGKPVHRARHAVSSARR